MGCALCGRLVIDHTDAEALQCYQLLTNQARRIPEPRTDLRRGILQPE